jgi:hypothetical protein
MKMKTTLTHTGLATSFSKKGDLAYVVSTIHRNEFGGFYQTSILTHPEMEMVYRIEAGSQMQAVHEHIDAVRMALGKPESAWRGTKDYEDDLMNELPYGSGEEHPIQMSWRDKKIRDVVQAANIGYVEPGKPGLFHMAAYLVALLFGGRLGWEFGSGYGTVLGVVGIIIGAVLCSTLVGVIAGLFGYRS